MSARIAIDPLRRTIPLVAGFSLFAAACAGGEEQPGGTAGVGNGADAGGGDGDVNVRPGQDTGTARPDVSFPDIDVTVEDPDAGSVDAGADAQPSDVGADTVAPDAAPPDVGVDTPPPDVGIDTERPDVGIDTERPDVGIDTPQPDVGTDTGTDTGTPADPALAAIHAALESICSQARDCDPASFSGYFASLEECIADQWPNDVVYDASGAVVASDACVAALAEYTGCAAAGGYCYTDYYYGYAYFYVDTYGCYYERYAYEDACGYGY